MVDSFASGPADPDHAMQLQIDEDLANAARINSEFERDFPEDRGAPARTLIDRAVQRPKDEALYPKLAAAQPAGPWLIPLVRRFVWNRDRGEAGAAWAKMLTEMVRLALSRVRVVSEAEFVALAEASEELMAHRGFGHLRAMAGLACRLEKAGPLSASVVAALHHLVRVCDSRHLNSGDRERLVWPLFRSENGFDSEDPCWSARVRRDLATLPPKLQSDWLKAWDPEPRSWQAAVKKLGSAEFERGLRRWVGLLREDPEPALSSDDLAIFRHFLNLCEALDGPACDEILYEIARTRWTEKPGLSWIHKYLEVLGRRPQNRAFACLEALMMNPPTAIELVRQRYEALLAVFGAQAKSETPVGVDGFPLDSDPRLEAQQRRIDQLLQMAATAAAQGPYVNPGMTAMTQPFAWFPVAPEVTHARQAMEAAILQEFASDPASLNRALTARSEWIRRHAQEYSKDTLQLWNEWLHGLGCGGGLVGRSLEQVEELTLESLLAVLKGGGNSTKVFELCQKYVAQHGWHADLIEPFRQFIPQLGTPSDRTENARAEWFLWFEDVAPIETGACWSYRVKQDLRRMPKEDAAAWRALLDNPAFLITGKPPAKWMKAAEKVFPPVGVAKFRRSFVQWFEPFAKGEPQRLTIAGRNLLRVLMWYALIAKDDAVDEALLGFGNAKWKTKQCAQRAAQAEMAFAYVVGQREPKGALAILEAQVKSGQAFEGSTTHRVYEELCARQKHTPVKAIPVKTKPAKERPNSILDNLTVGEFRDMLQGKDPGRHN